MAGGSGGAICGEAGRSLGSVMTENCGVTALAGGLVCRLSGQRSAVGSTMVCGSVGFAPQHYRQRPACLPRVWQR